MPNPETATQKPPEVQEFEGAGERLLSDFALDLYGVSSTEGTIITQSSLEVAIGNVSKAAAEDPSVLALVRAVNESNRLSSERGDSRPFVRVADRPELGLLKAFGAEIKIERPQAVSQSTETKKVEPEQVRRLGHQVLVDGHLVRGMIGRRPNEVVTSKGILRTRGTPRLDPPSY
jgi:hypothetical protein